MKDDKRQNFDVISWDSYFMGLAALASFRSKDPSTQNGSCIVKGHNPITNGYNGFPDGCSDDDFPWVRGEKGTPSYETKYPYAEHSERNAIFDAARRGVALEGATLYLYSEKGYYPCDECARAIIQSGIKRVVMAFAIVCGTDKYDWTATKRMFKAKKIEIVLLNDNKNIKDKLISDCRLISEKFKLMCEKI